MSEEPIDHVFPFSPIHTFGNEKQQSILFKKELIMRPCEGTYILYDMEEKLYTEKELLELEAKAEEEYGTESGYEVLYTLFKCAQLAREGNLIWCEIC